MEKPKKKYDIKLIVDYYFNKKKSLIEIESIIKIPAETLRKKLIKHKYKLRSKSEALKLKPSNNGTFKKGMIPHNYNGGTCIQVGYKFKLAKEHPRADKHGYMQEHILVMEKELGRYLDDKEQVHHLDGNKLNNNIDNLHLFKNNKLHLAYHKLLRKLVFKEIKKPIMYKIKHLYIDNKNTLEEVANKLNLTVDKVLTIMDHYNILRRKGGNQNGKSSRMGTGKLSKETIIAMRELYDTHNYSYSEISKLFNLNHNYTYNIIKRNKYKWVQ